MPPHKIQGRRFPPPLQHPFDSYSNVRVLRKGEIVIKGGRSHDVVARANQPGRSHRTYERVGSVENRLLKRSCSKHWMGNHPRAHVSKIWTRRQFDSQAHAPNTYCCRPSTGRSPRGWRGCSPLRPGERWQSCTGPTWWRRLTGRSRSNTPAAVLQARSILRSPTEGTPRLVRTLRKEEGQKGGVGRRGGERLTKEQTEKKKECA